jgi:hypothetical protein
MYDVRSAIGDKGIYFFHTSHIAYPISQLGCASDLEFLKDENVFSLRHYLKAMDIHLLFIDHFRIELFYTTLITKYKDLVL